MKHVTKLFVLGLVVLAINGCGTASNSVNNGGLIQKRKYTRGFYLDLHQRGKSADQAALPTDEPKRLDPLENTAKGHEAMLPSEAVFPEVAVENAEQMPASVVRPAPAADNHYFPVLNKAAHSKSAPGAAERSKNNRSVLRKVVENKKVKQHLKKVADNGEGAVMLLLLIILAFILPPLAVALYEGFTGRFILDLIFWILGISSGLLIAPWAFVFLIVSVVYALFIVLGA